MNFTTISTDEVLQYLENCNYIGAKPAIQLINDLNKERSRLKQRVLDLEETGLLGKLLREQEQLVLDAFERGKAFGFAEGMRSMKRTPVPDQQLLKLAADKFHYTEYKLAIELARDVERAHGIA